MAICQWPTSDEVDRVLWEHETNVAVPWFLHANSSRTAILNSDVAMIDQVPFQPLHVADELGILRNSDEILAYSRNK